MNTSDKERQFDGLTKQYKTLWNEPSHFDLSLAFAPPYATFTIKFKKALSSLDIHNGNEDPLTFQFT